MTAPKATKKRRVPAPSTPEGELFHYTPAEAAEWLPFSPVMLRKKAHARQIPHNGGGNRVTFTGLDIRAISAMHAVPAVADKKRARVPGQRPAA